MEIIIYVTKRVLIRFRERGNDLSWLIAESWHNKQLASEYGANIPIKIIIPDIKDATK